MEKKYENINSIIEVGIYLYIMFMFLTKGESIRNILIFGNFALWLFTLKHRKNLYLLKNPVSILCWIFLGVLPFSVIFSIDPLYSFMELRHEPLKFALLFPVISTVMSDKTRLKRAVYVCFFTSILIVSIGYYSYLAHDIQVLRPDTALMDTGDTGHNKFARYLITLLPFSFILYFMWQKKAGLRALLAISFIISVFALILSSSRGGYTGFLSMVFIWALFLSRTKKYNLHRIMSVTVVVILMLGTLSWFSSPGLRERISLTAGQLPTLNDRTETWKSAVSAFKQRPLFGWGYGNRIFHQDEPYKNTPYRKAPPKGPHNTFLRILFLQGIAGIIPFVLLLLTAIKAFWKDAFKTEGIKSYIPVACVSVLIGNFIINSIFADLHLHYMSVVLGLGIAAGGTDENSHT